MPAWVSIETPRYPLIHAPTQPLGARLRPDRPELPKEFVAVHKRRRMIDAIASLSAERGYEATKIADVVRTAGVARKTLYDNFEGKEDLFLAALDGFLGDARAAVEEACAEQPEELWRERVEAGLGAFLACVAERPAAARMALLESPSATATARARHEAALRGYVELLRAQTPAAADLPETLEETLVGGVAWVIAQRFRRGEAASAPDLLAELTEFVLSPYHGVAETTAPARRK